MKFIGRTEELKTIHKFLSSEGQKNLLIYGRRRIGKSFLIRKALENINSVVLHYQCKEISIESTISDLTKEIVSKINIKYNIVFNSLEEIFDFLFSRTEDIVFVIDEYPYLLKKVEGLDSIIQNKIDLNKMTSNLKLIISGSQIDGYEYILYELKDLYDI